MVALAEVPSDPHALSEVSSGVSLSDPQVLSFSVSVTKLAGASLGIDVAYRPVEAWAKRGVFVSKIFDHGLVAAICAKSPEPRRVKAQDFIFQVNNVHGDVVSIVEEMKTQQQLTIHFLRRKTTSLAPMADSPPPGMADRSNEVQVSVPAQVSVTSLLPRLAELDDAALAGLVFVVLQGRPWLRDSVLGPKEHSLLPDTELLKYSPAPVDAECEQSGADGKRQDDGADDQNVIDLTADGPPPGLSDVNADGKDVAEDETAKEQPKEDTKKKKKDSKAKKK